MSSAAMRFLCVAAMLVACSSKSDGGDDGNGGGSRDGGNGGNDSSSGGGGGGNRDGGSTGGSTTGGSSTSGGSDDEPVGDDLQLLFNPMYSAYDGEHQFKLPAIVQGGLEDLEWSARPSDAVDIDPDSETGGVLITTRKPGDVLIIARAGALSGSAMLHITDSTPELWEIGEMRYNNEIPFPDFMLPDSGPDGGRPIIDANGLMIPDNLSCRNCHGSTATALDVEHTPQQTGGYSDEDLIKIFTMGMKPANAKFHTPFPESLYVRFHTWDATADEQKGLVTYLRSLTPKAQGMLDFQGLRDQFM